MSTGYGEQIINGPDASREPMCSSRWDQQPGQPTPFGGKADITFSGFNIRF
jgi:hypothetical protein